MRGGGVGGGEHEWGGRVRVGRECVRGGECKWGGRVCEGGGEV
jgi:hypothetical protein